MFRKLITKLVFDAYKVIGTRIEVMDIYNDIHNYIEAKIEFFSVIDALSTYRNKWILELSTRRLKACLMWLVDDMAKIKISSHNWSIDDFKSAIEVLKRDKLVFYDNKLIMQYSDEVIENTIPKLTPELVSLILLIKSLLI